jgi:hypothetical protein
MHALKGIGVGTFDNTFAWINIILDINGEVFILIPIVVRIDFSIPKIFFVFTHEISQKLRNSCIDWQMFTVVELNAD